jgi:tyrosyl-tRNA synthetase
MSKSLGNSIGISDPPEEMYGKVMSIPDSVMADYFDLLSAGQWEADRPAFSASREGTGEPMALKHRLAGLIVERLHGSEAAEGGAAHFRRVVQQKGVPEDVPEGEIQLAGEPFSSLLDVLTTGLEMVASRSEVRRLVAQGAIEINGERAADANQPLAAGSYLVRVGKRRYLRLTVHP